MKIQGIKKYHDMESYLEKHLLNNKDILESIIKQLLIELHMEVRFNGIRVDLVGQGEDNSIIFVETSIRDNTIKDFHKHREHILDILKIIGKDKFAQIILISPQFLNEDIKEIESCITLFNVKIFFIQLSKNIIFKLHNTSIINKLFDNKDLIFSNYLSVTSKNINKKNLFTLEFNREKDGNKISYEILEGLRKKLDWHMPIHRYKDLSGNVIKIGSGISDVMFNIYCNQKDKVKIEINFAKRYDVFDIFKNHMIDMSYNISSPLNISSKKASIYSEIPNDANIIRNSINVSYEYITYVTGMYKKIEI